MLKVPLNAYHPLQMLMLKASVSENSNAICLADCASLTLDRRELESAMLALDRNRYVVHRRMCSVLLNLLVLRCGHFFQWLPYYCQHAAVDITSPELCLSLHFNSHFSGGPGFIRYQNVSVVDFVGAEGDGGGDDNWSYKTSHRHHQQTNTQLFTGQMPSVSPSQHCYSTEGKHFTETTWTPFLSRMMILPLCFNKID